MSEKVEVVEAHRKWIAPEASPASGQRGQDVALEVACSPAIARVLLNRGIDDAQHMKALLEISPELLHDPYLMQDMERVVNRLVRALDQNHHIVINGDYDADGVTGTSLLVTELRGWGARVDFFIPNREKDGYGISPRLIERAAKIGVEILISVDCGSSDHEAIELAREKGIDVIVVDHHEIPVRPPAAFAVLNPKQASCKYPFKGLSAVGVAYKVLQGIQLQRNGSTELVGGLEFVAMGTLADVQPMVDENRILVGLGLRQLGNSQRPGIRALCRAAGVSPAPSLRSGQVGFQLAPRLNAVGRIGSAKLAVDLLVTQSETEASTLAGQVEAQNQKRRSLSGIVTEEAQLMAADRMSRGDCSALVLASKSWHPGVVGIAAARLLEEFGVPTVVIGLQEGVGKGSARCRGAFDVRAALDESRDFLLKYGGHRQAAGLTMDAAQLSDFIRSFEAAIQRQTTKGVEAPALEIDTDLQGEELTPELLRGLDDLEPFGVDHAEPLFRVRHMLVGKKTRIVGQDHLKLQLVFPSGEPLDAIAFRRGKNVDLGAIIGQRLDVVGYVRRQDPRYGGDWQMVVQDMSTTEDGESELSP